MTETRQERFKRLAVYRTNAVLEKLRILGNLSNRANYDYSDEDVRKIFRAIEKEIGILKPKFLVKSRREFKL